MSYWIEAGHVGEDAGKRREGQDRAIGLVEGERALSTVCWRAINFSSDLENRIDNVSSRMRDVFGVNRGSIENSHSSRFHSESRRCCEGKGPEISRKSCSCICWVITERRSRKAEGQDKTQFMIIPSIKLIQRATSSASDFHLPSCVVRA